MDPKNIFQHSEYLKGFIKQNQVGLTGVVQIPTPPMGLFSKKHTSINEIKLGQTITIPSDPDNVVRALVMLLPRSLDDADFSCFGNYAYAS